MTKHGLFVGLVTLDFIYLAESTPQNNQKLVATDYTVAAGGPATNAAVTFSYLGNQATVLGVVGSHPMTQLIRSDLEKYQVAIADLDSTINTPPPVSSIIVTQSTGERAVISINAVKTQADDESIPADILHNIDIVLIDGHQMKVGYIIAQMAKTQNIPVVIDGGSWKPGFEQILPLVDYAVCPPNCSSSEEVFTYLQNLGVPHIAITHGEQPIEYLSCDQRGTVVVPTIKPVDTLGAGDIFHGAFCHYILQYLLPTPHFQEALEKASQIAANACQLFGTRRWMDVK
jgi:sugar/nucleoside kinase (ribokinase family)